MRKMILADKIINERKKNGWSQEDLADMLDVSRQSVSKWEGAQSVPDLNKILKLAEIFGVSTDYLLKDEMEPESASAYYNKEDSQTGALRRVSMEDATEYISLKKEHMPKIGLGVFLCITCPVVLIMLSGLTDAGKLPIGEGAAAAIGLIVLFAQVGFAIYLFLIHAGKLKKYDFLEREAFETEYGVDGMARTRMEENENANMRALTTGVLLCVLGVVPLIVCSCLNLASVIVLAMVCLLLLEVGIAVYLFLSVCGVHSAYKVLLQTDDYTTEMKRRNVRLEPMSRIYWMSIVVIYLAVSFLTNRWDMTWIIWAVSGVLYGVIRAIGDAIVQGK